jgi:TRAP-type mannitol/chloroaromatic compound transport system permease small subunit
LTPGSPSGRGTAKGIGARLPMLKVIAAYVRWVDAANKYIGLFAVYLVVAMFAILIYSTIAKVFFHPSLWSVETAQFVMVSYYLLGGGYTLQNDEHVRMDILYARWSIRKRAKADVWTDLVLIFFLVVLLIGGISSTVYALKTNEHSYSAWSPYMAPVKIVMTFGIFMTLLQAVAFFFKDFAAARGKPLA